MAIDADTSTFLTWEQVQALQLPPNTTVLVPPPPPEDLTVPLQPPPQGAPEWLEDGYYPQVATASNGNERPPAKPADENAAQAAAEREKYGDPALRLMTGLIATNAILERIQNPPRKDEEEEEKKKKK